jgi:hypothetical protein
VTFIGLKEHRRARRAKKQEETSVEKSEIATEQPTESIGQPQEIGKTP